MRAIEPPKSLLADMAYDADVFRNWRCIATRYNRPAKNNLAALDLVSIVVAWS